MSARDEIETLDRTEKAVKVRTPGGVTWLPIRVAEWLAQRLDDAPPRPTPEEPKT